ncbi:unnamed protein product [Orchesella dallaii]|uniref:Uncharacterized protein n=1 Tax=Orchesella dallaii TaxID=48710 RepID=A0ABP1Q7D0_9HEXA
MYNFRRETRARSYAALETADQHTIKRRRNNAQASSSPQRGPSSAIAMPQSEMPTKFMEVDSSRTSPSEMVAKIKELEGEIEIGQKNFSDLKKRTAERDRKKNAEIRKLRKELATKTNSIRQTKKELGKESKQQQKLKAEIELMQQRQQNDYEIITLRKSLKETQVIMMRLEFEKKTGVEKAATEKLELEKKNTSLKEEVNELRAWVLELEMGIEGIRNKLWTSQTLLDQAVSPIAEPQRPVARVRGYARKKPEGQINNTEEGQRNRPIQSTSTRSGGLVPRVQRII